MAGKRSAGILLYRSRDAGLEVLLGHMGGPLWSKRDAGAWSIPKGEYEADEDPVRAAHREFGEELGLDVPAGPLVDLGSATTSGGKLVTIWAVEGELDPGDVVPGTFTVEWPRGSGRVREFPEIDRVEWFDTAVARDRIVRSQRAFLDRLDSFVGR